VSIKDFIEIEVEAHPALINRNALIASSPEPAKAVIVKDIILSPSTIGNT